MKRLFLALLCLLLLTGCALPDEEVSQSGGSSAVIIPQATETIIASTEVPEIPLLNTLQPGELPATAEEWVIENYNQTISWQDMIGGYHSVTISLPALQPVTEFATAYNEAVHTYATRVMEDILYCRSSRYGCDTVSITYEAYQKDDILSILIIRRTRTDYCEYMVRCFDLSEGRSLNASDLCAQLLGIDYPTFLLATNALSLQDFEDRCAALVTVPDEAALTPDELDALTQSRDYYERVRDSISADTENMLARELFIGENGQVMLLYNSPTMDSMPYLPAAFVPTVIPFSMQDIGWLGVPTGEQAYRQLFDLLSYVADSSLPSYAAILMTAFRAEPELFTEYAATEDSDTIHDIAALLPYALSYDEIPAFRAQIQSLLEQELTEQEKDLLNHLLTNLDY